jgi:hypothetical protein
VLFWGTDAAGRRYLYRVDDEGGSPQKAYADPLIWVYDVSPDGQTAAVWRGAGVELVSLHGGPTITASMVCAAAGGENRGTTPPCASWSADGQRLFMHDRTAGLVFAIPIANGAPPIPPGGFTSGSQLASWPGARRIDDATAFPGRDPSIYAFFHVTTQRNIYRVRVPEERE